MYILISQQFVCIAQTDYYRILTQGKSNVKVIEEGGEVVMVTEHRSTDGGNREGQVVIKVSQDLGINEIKGDVVVVHSGVLGDHVRVLSGSIRGFFLGSPVFLFPQNPEH